MLGIVHFNNDQDSFVSSRDRKVVGRVHSGSRSPGMQTIAGGRSQTLMLPLLGRQRRRDITRLWIAGSGIQG
jgi:hypothetical protein